MSWHSQDSPVLDHQLQGGRVQQNGSLPIGRGADNFLTGKIKRLFATRERCSDRSKARLGQGSRRSEGFLKGGQILQSHRARGQQSERTPTCNLWQPDIIRARWAEADPSIPVTGFRGDWMPTRLNSGLLLLAVWMRLSYGVGILNPLRCTMSSHMEGCPSGRFDRPVVGWTLSPPKPCRAATSRRLRCPTDAPEVHPLPFNNQLILT